ncbi:MAG TPA: GatB/YqeY domain-containing protein [Candidatus Paceibacterota bacterium]|nr:GatB/YqeY domain-containing protein [Candidatus Paceibacterota bacterium]
MSLSEKLKDDLKASMKSGNAERLGVLRMLIAEVNNKQKAMSGAVATPLTDEEVIAVFQKEAKKRRESIELFKKGNRDDLVKKEEAELAIIREFLPQQMGEAEIKAVIDKLAAAGVNDFNSLMKESMKELKGKADGKLVGEIIKKKLVSS